jgi:hypothetical protein
MELNSNFIQLSGKAEIDTPLELSRDYDVMIRCNCTSIQKQDRQDQTYDFIYKIRPTGTIGMIDDKGEVKAAKVIGSKSKKLRWEIEKVDDYDMVMDICINHPEELCEWAQTTKLKYGK